MDLDAIRKRLIRLEDTLIFALIERAQYKLNKEVVNKESAICKIENKSLLDFCLYDFDRLAAQTGRFSNEIYVPFYDVLAEKLITLPNGNAFVVDENDVNYNSIIKQCYCEEMLPFICEDGDDQYYWECCMADIQCLRSLTQRIHYGKVVAEIKYQQCTEELDKLIMANDRLGIMSLITDSEVEKRVLARVRQKAIHYGQEPDKTQDSHLVKINAESVVDTYEKWIIPYTKEVECDYLLKRMKK